MFKLGMGVETGKSSADIVRCEVLSVLLQLCEEFVEELIFRFLFSVRVID